MQRQPNVTVIVNIGQIDHQITGAILPICTTVNHITVRDICIHIYIVADTVGNVLALDTQCQRRRCSKSVSRTLTAVTAVSQNNCGVLGQIKGTNVKRAAHEFKAIEIRIITGLTCKVTDINGFGLNLRVKSFRGHVFGRYFFSRYFFSRYFFGRYLFGRYFFVRSNFLDRHKCNLENADPSTISRIVQRYPNIAVIINVGQIDHHIAGSILPICTAMLHLTVSDIRVHIYFITDTVGNIFALDTNSQRRRHGKSVSRTLTAITAVSQNDRIILGQIKGTNVKRTTHEFNSVEIRIITGLTCKTTHIQSLNFSLCFNTGNIGSLRSSSFFVSGFFDCSHLFTGLINRGHFFSRFFGYFYSRFFVLIPCRHFCYSCIRGSVRLVLIFRTSNNNQHQCEHKHRNQH